MNLLKKQTRICPVLGCIFKYINTDNIKKRTTIRYALFNDFHQNLWKVYDDKLHAIISLVLYVDDILLIGNDILTLQGPKIWLSEQFSMKDLGGAVYILGIKIYRDRSKRLLGLSQSMYIDTILKRYNMDNSKRGYLPVGVGITLSRENCSITPEERERMSRVPYASVVGAIMYTMTCTHPNVAYALGVTSRYQANPGE